VRLKELAPALFAAGLRHLNLSLDTLRRDRYREITGRDEWPAVMAGLEAATSLGFYPIKINCVVLKGLNEDELLDIALLARDHPYQVRFIELMPTVSSHQWQRHFLPMATVRRRLAVLGRGQPMLPSPTAGPARTFRFPGFQGELGFISPISDHHCPTCNRLRLTAEGKLRPCLMADAELDLKEPMRLGLADAFLSFLFQEAIDLKTARARPPLSDFSIPGPPMVSMGG
jgi:cyclic pyranopterin phosphate synthase